MKAYWVEPFTYKVGRSPGPSFKARRGWKCCQLSVHPQNYGKISLLNNREWEEVLE